MLFLNKDKGVIVNEIRVRIAPSPTGYLHVGTAHTALYNWFFARKNGGKFILRIEDTDIERSTKDMVDIIIESLKWLGIDWDEGPYFQSERYDQYREAANILEKKGYLYRCYCNKEEIEERRDKLISEGKAWKYDRHCLNLTEEQKERYEREGRLFALRFKVPEGITIFSDGLHNEIKRDNSEIEDFVVVRGNGHPTYNFAVVIDDSSMHISHIMRGEDHISNTPKQILIYNALDLDVPKFIHLPLILGEDRSKLSKRKGTVAVTDYRDMGYLPNAFVNFLALLGWSPAGEKEILSREELIDHFSIEALSKRSAIFDKKKLLWINAEYIKHMDAEELYKYVKPLWKKANFDLSLFDHNTLMRVIDLIKERARLLTDFVDSGYYFFREFDNYDEKGVNKHFINDYSVNYLTLLSGEIEKLDKYSPDVIENLYRKIVEERNISAGKLIHPTRLALTGKTVGPSLFHLMEFVGKNRTLDRIKKAIDFINREND
jgi:glutamyl-tRNA synthetase